MASVLGTFRLRTVQPGSLNWTLRAQPCGKPVKMCKSAGAGRAWRRPSCFSSRRISLSSAQGKLGGLILLATLALTGCSAPAAPASETQAPLQGVAPLAAAPSPSATLAPEFTDATSRGQVPHRRQEELARRGTAVRRVPVGRGSAACPQFSKGLTHSEIGGLGGTTGIEWDNADAIAIYASRTFCTAYLRITSR